MASRMSEAVQHLGRALLLREWAGLTDGQLLECFVSRRAGAALEALVRRHAPMVWGVCRRLVPWQQDAEDAFQATFLVLVRKAASIVPREMVVNWLHGVARQTALKARATAARRRGRERQVSEMPDRAGPDQAPWDDLRPLLDRELSRLPARYRVVVLLCDLEGKTRSEGAAQRGGPEGTVAGRLSRARAMLARQLARAGVLAAGASLAVVLSQNAAAGVPAPLVSVTLQAASAAPGAVSGP